MVICIVRNTYLCLFEDPCNKVGSKKLYPAPTEDMLYCVKCPNRKLSQLYPYCVFFNKVISHSNGCTMLLFFLPCLGYSEYLSKN